MPNIFLIGGPNGAGKTTIALQLFPEILHSHEFVNADFIAKGLSAFNTESVAVAAGRLMLKRIHDLKLLKKDFAFESTLASRSLVSFLKSCKAEGYRISLAYIWIENAEIALRRIRMRMREGGHSIPEGVVARRYQRSVFNVVNLYLPLVDRWKIYDNTYAEPRVIAASEDGSLVNVLLPQRMELIMKNKIQEPQQEYVADRMDAVVKKAVADELERKRKLGLPIVFGKDGKVVVMIGDKIVEEIPYGKNMEQDVTAHNASTRSK